MTYLCNVFDFRSWQEQVRQFFNLSFRDRTWSSLLQLKVYFLNVPIDWFRVHCISITYFLGRYVAMTFLKSGSHCKKLPSNFMWIFRVIVLFLHFISFRNYLKSLKICDIKFLQILPFYFTHFCVREFHFILHSLYVNIGISGLFV